MSLDISGVERDTGLSKDTLRMWERRYGFPRPDRDANGDRIYPLQQVQKLQLIRRLMDRGHRPGKIIAQHIGDLEALDRDSRSQVPPGREIVELIELVRTHRLPELRQRLIQALVRQGLHAFATQTVREMNRAVGDLWARGEIAVFEEHLYTELVQTVLRSAISTVPNQARGPRVLLTSFPGEPHGLGLLMVEALLAMEGASCVPLGTETPLQQIARAAQAHRADVVALSFSASFTEKRAVAGLSDLRSMLDATVAIWAGGSGLLRMRSSIESAQVMCDLALLPDRVRAWRALHEAR